MSLDPKFDPLASLDPLAPRTRKSGRKRYRKRWPDDEDDAHCDRCGRAYKSINALESHKRLECGLPPKFVCYYCEYRSKRKSDIKRHIGYTHPSKSFQYKIDDE